jgi:SAM-dependent methyltransferase
MEDYIELPLQADTSRAWTAGRVLALLGAELCGHPRVDLEFSLRLGRRTVTSRGRFGCWVGGRAPDSFEPLARLLERLEAPPPVRAAQRSIEAPVREGVCVAFDESGPEFRLYLHGRAPTTLADRYRAWRWRPGGDAALTEYTFHFLPETAAGLRPLDLVAPELRPAFARLLADERLRQSSGFWLREGARGRIEQVDLAFPWSPPARTLTGLLDLAEVLSLPREEPSGWRELAVRHVAVRVGAASPLVTLYASAPLEGPWPESEAALQERVRRGARAFNRDVERRVYRRLPPPATERDAGADLETFYDGEVSVWRAVLGAKLHYHAGLFDPHEAEPDDAAMDEALDRAVTELYPFVPAGGRVYDVGCGWGGALAMWARDLGCPSLGITNSREQFRHAAAAGLAVRRGDAEKTLPPGRFDCVVLLESLSHIRDKARLLRVLRLFAPRLVMRVNCQDGSPPGPAFGGTMHMVSSARLRELLESSGWRVRHWRDRRREALPSVAAWHRRLRSIPPSRDRHLETLRAWCARVQQAPREWARHNPLVEVAAD